MFVRSSWKNDLTTSEGNQVDAITSSYGFSQLIGEPTHILPNWSSCIDLIFINQNNLIMDSVVHASLHPNCHHQIVYAKLNSKIEYPPLYERLVKNIICNEKGTPWFNNKIKTLIEKKNHLFKSYMANGSLVVDHVRLQKAGAELINN